jgi:hypothetical protein
MNRHSGLRPEPNKPERDESRAMWDESRDTSFPRSWAITLVLAAAAYGLYRVVQTNITGAVLSPGLSFGQRTIISIADGSLMAALVPVAILSSRRFPSTVLTVRRLAITPRSRSATA